MTWQTRRSWCVPFEGRRTLLVTALGRAAVAGSFAVRFAFAGGRSPPRPALVATLGVVMLGGVALRAWSMHTLGEFFTRTLVVAPGQHVVRVGPYPMRTGSGRRSGCSLRSSARPTRSTARTPGA